MLLQNQPTCVCHHDAVSFEHGAERFQQCFSRRLTFAAIRAVTTTTLTLLAVTCCREGRLNAFVLLPKLSVTVPYSAISLIPGSRSPSGREKAHT